MPSTKDEEEPHKVAIPRQLYMEIIKIQASENMEWEDACLRAAAMIDPNSNIFKTAVERSFQKVYRTKFIKQLNVTREGIRTDAYRLGKANGLQEGETKNQIWYYCDVCGKKMVIAPNSNVHTKIIDYMREHLWGHTDCHNK